MYTTTNPILNLINLRVLGNTHTNYETPYYVISSILLLILVPYIELFSSILCFQTHLYQILYVFLN